MSHSDDETVPARRGRVVRPTPSPASLGPYRILRCVGSGGMGTVYEALDEERNARVALKTLPAVAQGSLLRFKREYRSLADLTHFNLATLYELMVVDDTWFFTMEFVDGVDFLRYVWGADEAPPGPHLAPDAEARLRVALRQLAIGVEALHAASLLHLDLKPANALVEPSGRVVVLDFGLVQSLDREPGAIDDEAGMLAGTPLYVSPEQVLGQRPTAASDWYAVGVILFQALTGAAPFEGPALEVTLARTRGAAPSVLERRPGTPADLATLCARLLAQDASARAAGRDVMEVCAGAREPGRAAPSPRAPLVGRDADLVALQQICDGAERPLCLFVKGASGVGKTTLINELLARQESAATPALVLRGRCYERESVPYKGFDAIVDALCRKLNSLPRSAQRALLDEDIHHAARLFSVLQDLEVLPSILEPATGYLDPQVLRSRAFAGLKRLLRRLCERQPLVLFIDDLHWADADSAYLLRELLAPPEAPQLLVIAAYRDDEAEYSAFWREIRAWRATRSLGFSERELVVEPLSLDDGARFARSVLGPACEPERAQAVAREAGGLPFFIEAVARYGGADAAAVQAVAPPSLHRVIDARLQEMPDEARRMLQVVAIAARPIEQALALAAAHVDGDAHAVLARLRSAHLVRTRGLRRNDTVEAYHDRIRQTVAATLDPAALSDIHRRLAHALEGRQAPPDVLAYHLHGAGELHRAADYAERAAEEAARALAFERAAGLFANALNWGKHMPDRARELLIKRAQALFNAGYCGEAAAVYLQAAEGAPLSERRELRRLAAEAFLFGGHVDEGLKVARELLREVGLAYPSSPTRAMLSLFAQLLKLRLRGIGFTRRAEKDLGAEKLFPVDLAWSLGKGLGNVLPPEGAYFMVSSLVGALRLGEPRRVGRSLAFVGGTALGTFDIGARYVERAEEIGREIDEPYLQGMPLIMKALVHLAYSGGWRTALQLVDTGVETLRNRSQGVSWEATLGTGIALKALEIMGELGQIAGRAVQWGRESKERGDLFAQVMAGQFQALTQIAAGDIDGARERDKLMLELWARDGLTTQHFYSLVLRVYCDRYQGRGDAAWEPYHGELAQLEKAYFLRFAISRIPLLYLSACLNLDRAAERPAQRAKLLEATHKLARRLGREERVDGPPHGQLLEAAVAAARDQRSEALALLAAARDAYRQVDMPLSAACADRRLGELGGEPARVTGADDEMRRLGIADPARWADAYAPRFA